MSDPVSVQVYVKGIAAVISLLFSAIILAGGPRRAANQYLSAFLFLIAGNQAMETFRALDYDNPSLPWYRLATIFAALDPFALYYFASIYPERNELNAPRKTALVLSISTLYAVLAAFAFDQVLHGPFEREFGLGLALYTFLIYVIVLIHVIRALPRGGGGASFRLLVPALALAAVPVSLRVVDDLMLWMSGWGIGLLPSDLGFRAVQVPAYAVAATVTIVAAYRLSTAPGALKGNDRWFVMKWLGAGALLGIVLHLQGLYDFALAIHLAPPGISFVILDSVSAAIRWILFGFFVTMAVLRYQMLDLSLTARRRAARIVVAALFFLLGAATLALGGRLLGRESVQLNLVDATVLGLVLVASQGFRTLLDRTAALLFGVPLPGDLAASLEVYRGAATQAAREGRPFGLDPQLRRLRSELGLDERTAGVVERMALAPAMGPLLPGQTVLGRYRILRMLGRGGSGRAFVAIDELLQREVVPKEVLHDESETEATALAEARVAGGLQHPNILTVFDVVQQPGISLIVTEYLAGGTLAERLRAEGPYPPAEGLRLLDGILAGLEAVHARGLVHRDLKPSNILLQTDGAPKIADFGLARIRRGTTARLDEPDLRQGTPEFMAPEQRRGEISTPVTDVYGVGRIAQALLDGRAPEPVRAVVARATETDPSRRWPSAAQMRGALRRTGPSGPAAARAGG